MKKKEKEKSHFFFTRPCFLSPNEQDKASKRPHELPSPQVTLSPPPPKLTEIHPSAAMWSYHSYAVSDGFGGEVAGELCPHHPTVAVGTHHLAPNHTRLVGLAARRHRVPDARTHAHTHVSTCQAQKKKYE